MSYVISPRRKVCTVCVLPVGGSLPAHLPAREGPPPADCAGQTLCARKQQEWQRRGRHKYSMCDKNRNVHNKSKPISVHIQDRLLEQHCRHLLLLIEYSLIICSVQTHRLSYQRLL